MFETYLSSVLIWTIIIGAMSCLCMESIKNNGWLDDRKSGNRGGFIGTVVVAAVPILRIGVAIMLLYMSVRTKEDFEKWKKTLD